MPITETYMTLESTFNWTEETEQEIFEKQEDGRRSFHLWKPVFPQKRNMKLTLAISARHAIENDLDPQRKVENGTKLLALLVEKCYQKNAIRLM
ncbi:hypothetical protein G9A89_013236 [Geosiphon pyriformis]|nr:hypothetical protein G9A89_013236 [Geosiphon pyriformis]